MTTPDKSRQGNLSYVFDEAADLYDRVRPSYPPSVADAIADRLPPHGRVLEIGVGTGQATRLLAPRGVSIVGLEPGRALAARAADNLHTYSNVRIEPVTFEEWPLQPAQFDLILSATAFHWLPPEMRYVKSAQALKEGGSLALLWNWPPDEGDAVWREIHEVYDRCLPPEPGTSPRTPLQTRLADWVEDISQSGLFSKPVVLQYSWSQWRTTLQHIQLLETFSDHRPLPEEKKRCLYGGITEILDRNGGGFAHPYIAALFLAQKL